MPVLGPQGRFLEWSQLVLDNRAWGWQLEVAYVWRKQIRKRFAQILLSVYIVFKYTFALQQSDGTSLETNRGSLSISSSFSNGIAVPQPQLPPSIFVMDQWVHRRTERILWLPPDHRPSRIAVHGSIIGFGYPSGRLLVMEFPSERFLQPPPRPPPLQRMSLCTV